MDCADWDEKWLVAHASRYVPVKDRLEGAERRLAVLRVEKIGYRGGVACTEILRSGRLARRAAKLAGVAG